VVLGFNIKKQFTHTHTHTHTRARAHIHIYHSRVSHFFIKTFIKNRSNYFVLLAYPQLSIWWKRGRSSGAEPLISRCTIGSANDELSLHRSCYYGFIYELHCYFPSICSCDSYKTHRKKTVYTNYFIIIRSRRLMIAICLRSSEVPLAKYVDDSYVKFWARGQRFILERVAQMKLTSTANVTHSCFMCCNEPKKLLNGNMK